MDDQQRRWWQFWRIRFSLPEFEELIADWLQALLFLGPLQAAGRFLYKRILEPFVLRPVVAVKEFLDTLLQDGVVPALQALSQGLKRRYEAWAVAPWHALVRRYEAWVVAPLDGLAATLVRRYEAWVLTPLWALGGAARRRFIDPWMNPAIAIQRRIVDSSPLAGVVERLAPHNPFAGARRVNLRFAAVLLVAALVVGGGSVVLRLFQVRRVLPLQAERAAGRGDLALAAQYWAYYLSFQPADTDARARLGLTLQRLPNPRSRARATVVLRDVLNRQPHRMDIVRALVSLEMELRDYSIAIHHLKILQPQAEAADDCEYLLGRCYQAVGEEKFTQGGGQRPTELNEAANWYRQALERTPTHLGAAESLASLLRRRFDQSREADEVMDQLSAADPDSYAIYVARARYRRGFSVSGAADDLARAEGLAPNAADVLLARAEWDQHQGALSAARTVLTRAVAVYPKDARFYKALAGVELLAGQPEAAAASARQGLSALPDSRELKWVLIDVLLQAGRASQARDLIAALGPGDFPGPLRGYLDAKLLALEGRPREAAARLQRFVPQLAAWPDVALHAGLLLGRCYEQLGDPVRQLAAYRQALATETGLARGYNPGVALIHYGLGSVKLAMGKTGEALGEFRQMLHQPGVPEAGLLVLVEVLLAHNQTLPAWKRDWKEAEQALARAADALPHSPQVPILTAELALARNDAARAQAVLQEARSRHPHQIELWTALAALALLRDDPATAHRLLEEARHKLGDSVTLRLAEAQYWLASRDPAASLRLRELERGADGFSTDDRRRLLYGLGAAHYQRGDRVNCERLWGDLARQLPGDVRLRLTLVDLAREAGDQPALERLEQELRRAEGEDGALGFYAAACRNYLRARAPDRAALLAARADLAQVARRRPDWPRALLLEADLDALDGQGAASLDKLVRAIHSGARDPQAVQRALRLLSEQRRFVEADLLLRQFEEEQAPFVAGLRRMAAEIALGARNNARALNLARATVARDDRDYRNLLWLGQLLGTAGQSGDAEQTLRQAVRLAGQVPETWAALLQHLARHGQPRQFEEALAEARRTLPAEMAGLVAASGYEALGRPAQAEAEYRAALALAPADASVLRAAAAYYLREGLRPTAQPVLQQLLQRRGLPEVDVAWARRGLALCLCAETGYASYREALRLIDDNLRTAINPAADERARAVVLASRPSVVNRRVAIALLEKWDARLQLSAGDRLLLARLYDAGGEPAQAEAQLRQLVALDERNPEYLAAAIAVLLQRREFDQARLQLVRLQRLEPDRPRTVDLRARALFLEGKVSEAAAVLQDFLKNPGKGPTPVGERAGQYRLILGRLSEFAATLRAAGKAADADALAERIEPLFRAYADLDPRGVLDHALYLARIGRPAPALELCARGLSAGTPEAGAACLAVLGMTQPDAAQLRRVEGWLEAALRARPDELDLLTALASLRDLQGRYDESIILYRRALARQPRDSQALNNLAWLLGVKDNQGAEAMSLVDRALGITGPHPAVLDTRAAVYLSLGQADRAIADLREVVVEVPTAASYFHLACAYRQANDPAAHEALEKAIALGLKPDNLHPLVRQRCRGLLDELPRHK